MTFHCPHFSVGNVTAARCGACGPLTPVPSGKDAQHRVIYLCEGERE